MSFLEKVKAIWAGDLMEAPVIITGERTAFSDLSKGLWLPNRKLLVPWGGSFESLRDSADEANDWLPHGHTERYGQLHWQNEPLLPGENTQKGHTGGVIAYVRGILPTVRQFSLGVRNDGMLRHEVFQYHAWMTRLIPILGTPSVDTSQLASRYHIVPPCEWQQGKVRVSLKYAFMKSDPTLELSISHPDFPLHRTT